MSRQSLPVIDLKMGKRNSIAGQKINLKVKFVPDLQDKSNK
jgi:hypothetical protein